MQTIRTNRSALVELRQLSSGESVAVVDDFLVSPEELSLFAWQHADSFTMPPKSYPGIVLPVAAEPMAEIYRFIRTTLSPHFSFLRGGAQFQSTLSMTTLKTDELSNLQRLCHTDPPVSKNRLNFAFVLYLFDNEELGGTGFYRWKDRPLMEQATALEMQDPRAALAFLKKHFPTYNKPATYITVSNEIAELLAVVPARFNRWVFYSGDTPHSAFIKSPEDLSKDCARGRLTLNCFASVIPK